MEQDYDNHTREPVQASSLFPSLDRFTVSPRKVGDRQRLLGDIGELLNDRNYKKLAVRFEGIPTPWLQEAFDKARSWKTNPPALFNKLIKEIRSPQVER